MLIDAITRGYKLENKAGVNVKLSLLYLLIGL